MSILKLILYVLPLCGVTCFPNPSEDYPHNTILKSPDIYRLFWKNEVDSITFEIQVRTKGWVGFGISPNGGMAGSDIFTAWLEDGKVIHHDRHALGTFRPLKDKLQDWNLIFGKEIDNYSVYKFSRKYETCDKEGDRDIKLGTVRVIWSYNPVRPFSEEQDIFYHGFLNRGTASLNLRVNDLKQKREDLLRDAFPVELTVKNFVLPHNIHTTYVCSFYSIDRISFKHHAIAGEPILNANVPSRLHHLIVYICNPKAANYSAYLGKDSNCLDVRDLAKHCDSSLYGWAVGGTTYYLPPHIGIPVGEEELIVMTESHYDNSNFQEGIVENSGYRLWFTDNLRQYDGTIFAVGIEVSPFQIIPPRESSFTSIGHCPAECLNDGFDESNVEEVKIIGYLPHSHLVGIRIRLRIFRGDEELEPIAIENAYDFDYQNFLHLQTERVLKRGDRLVTECDYNTLNRKEETLGGLATENEMCIVFLTVYPKFAVRKCGSHPATSQFASLYDDPVKRITDWSNPQKKKIAQEIALSNDIELECNGNGIKLKSHRKILSMPLVSHFYAKIDTCDRFPIPSEKYPHSVVLKEPDFYKVYWKVVEDVITFEIHVKTKGWAGFGISPNGNMIGSDVIMTWMGENGLKFDDRHIVGYVEPLIDDVQNWHLITGRRYGEYLIVKFYRELDTCDIDDIAIGEATTRIVWSYRNEVVISDEAFYHGFTSRGTKSVHLLADETDDRDGKPIEGAFPFDVRITNFSIPHTVDTFYQCEIFKLPELDKKHHIVAVEAIVDERNPSVPHHLLLYGCNANINLTDEDVGKGYECYNRKANYNGRYDSCEAILFVWAIGGKRQYFPDNVGYPVGRDTDVKFLRLEFHYDNPSFKKNIVDTSGLRLWLTDKNRKEDLQTIQVGHVVTGAQVIPPMTPLFVSFGACPSQCLSEAMERGGVEEITIVSILLHGHLLSKALKLRHFRNGVELKPLADDPYYDFNFQSFVSLKEPRKVRKGDWLLLECDYDSSDRMKVTRGGLGTRDEMCIAFLTSYPNIPLSHCLSHPQIPELTKIGKLEELIWTRDIIEQHQMNVATPNVTIKCNHGSILHPIHTKDITLPSVNEEYTPLNSTCQLNGQA